MIEHDLPSDPSAPMITTAGDLAAALAQRFIDNAACGDNAANDELVEQLIEWKRRRGERSP